MYFVKLKNFIFLLESTKQFKNKNLKLKNFKNNKLLNPFCE